MMHCTSVCVGEGGMAHLYTATGGVTRGVARGVASLAPELELLSDGLCPQPPKHQRQRHNRYHQQQHCTAHQQALHTNLALSTSESRGHQQS